MTDEEKLILHDKIKNGQLAINELCGLLNKQVKRIGNNLNVPKECQPMIDEGIAILEEIISYYKILGQDYEFDIRMLDSFKTMKTKINYGSAEI